MKIPSRAFFAFSLVVLFCFNAFAQQTADAFYKQGIEQIKTHKYDAAIASFTEAIKLNPAYLEAYLERSKARENNQRDLEGAFADVEKVIELNPSHGEAHFRRAVIRYAQIVKQREASNDAARTAFRKMLADLNAAIGYGYKTKDAYARRAEVKCPYLNDCETAIVDYNAAIALDPNDFYLYINRCNAKRRTKDFAGAAADLHEIVSRYYANQTTNSDETQKKKIENQRATVALALVNISIDLMINADNDLALNAINQAIEIAPNDGHAYRARGRYKIIFGDLDEAVADLDKSLQFQVNNPVSLIYRGAALFLSGKTDEAQKDFDKANEIMPSWKNQISTQLEAFKKQREQKKVKIELQPK